ncbi:XdhC family protein [Brevibacillus borstelensis]|uniref:XdhC family protein n=1 Tax=Brevibacillus borstelensis TaxID=45462 RepID=UPI003CF9A9A5
MRDHAWIINMIKEAKTSGKRYAMATVVHVKGSAYRREGAKMLVDEEGKCTGMISGGCLEADVAEVAKQVLETGAPTVKTYVMDEDLVWGLGLGCPGTVEIYIEPLLHACSASDERQASAEGSFGNQDVPTHGDSVYDAWLSAIEDERAGILFTRLDTVGSGQTPAPFRLFVPEAGESIGSTGDLSLDWLVTAKARQLFLQKNPKSASLRVPFSEEREAVVFADVYIPPAEVIIFGAGHDAVPLAKTSVAAGFRTTVVDPRPAYNTEDRFPGTTRLLTDDKNGFEPLKIGNRSYIIIMNHHLERDIEALRFSLQTEAPYIGVLGPRSRCDRILKIIEGRGDLLREERLARLHNPVGLDIGAETAEEIALSIVTEVLAVHNGHQGHFLRGKERIHQPS